MTEELDVREVPKPKRHPLIFDRYDALALGASFVLVVHHDPQHLREEFELEFPRGYRWDYLERGPGIWRIRIGKLAATPLPRIVGNTSALPTEGAGSEASGAVWKLQMTQRDLDANVVRLPPGNGIDAHAGPDLDVLLVVLAGEGHLATEVDTLDLSGGALVWLPRRSRRRFLAGPNGLAYLTVHQRRQSLVLQPPTPA